MSKILDLNKNELETTLVKLNGLLRGRYVIAYFMDEDAITEIGNELNDMELCYLVHSLYSMWNNFYDLE